MHPCPLRSISIPSIHQQPGINAQRTDCRAPHHGRSRGRISWAINFETLVEEAAKPTLLMRLGLVANTLGRTDVRRTATGNPDAPGLREEGWQDIRGLLGSTKRKREDDAVDEQNLESQKRSRTNSPPGGARESETTVLQGEDSHTPVCAQIFRGLNLYLNGSTAPLVSDHKLKQLWVQHGGSVSIGLGRRTVTHVVLGQTSTGGGSLASSKIQKEVVRGSRQKYSICQCSMDPRLYRQKEATERG